MQTPQGLDATHGGELFPIEREWADAYLADPWMRASPASFAATHSGGSFP